MGETNEDVDNLCPLCMEEMDLTDRHLRPCHCGYQLCVWCWHQIMELGAKDNTEGRCPACRTPYDKEKIVGAASNCEELIDLAVDKKRPHKVKAKALEGRKHLSNVRVMQRNLVYVVGFPLNLADEENLEKREFFGQYGRILKVAVSRSSSYSGHHSHNSPSASVYVTYVREEDALRCIRAVDGCILDGKLLRACFGTNKYCNAWLKNTPCNNPDCLYLHDEGTEEDSFTKEEMLAKYGSKHQHFHELTHPPHRVVGVGLPPPLPEVSTTLCSSLPGIPQIHHQTSRALGRPSISSSGLGKVASLPAAASWGMRGKAAATKASTSTNLPKKRPAGLTCPSSCLSSALPNPSLMGVIPTSVCDESNKFASAADTDDRLTSSSSNFRTTKSDALYLVQNEMESHDVKEWATSSTEPVYCSAPSMQLNIGDVNISLCSSFVDVMTVHDEFLPKQDSLLTSSLVLEKTMNAMDEESTLINSSTAFENKEVIEEEFLKALTSESPIDANDPPVLEDNLLQVARPTKARIKSPPQLRGDNNIISDILTMDFNEDGSFRSPVDFAKLLRTGSSNPLVVDNCNELPVSWKPQSSSQSRFSFARLKDHEQLNGVVKSHFPSSGDFSNQWIATSQMHSSESLGSIIYAEDKMNAISVKTNSQESDFDHATSVSTEFSLAGHEIQTSREVPLLHTIESTVTSASLMNATKARLDAPPGFSTPTKLLSVYPPGFNLQNVTGRATFHGPMDQLQAESVSSGVSGLPLAAPHVTDNQSVSDLELIDPAIMAVGRGKLPFDVGQIGPLDAAQVVPSFNESSQSHHPFMQGASGINSDSFDLDPRLTVLHRQSGMPDFDALLNHQQQRAVFVDDKYYSLPYQQERHNNDQVMHSLSRLSSVIDGPLSSRMLGHYEGNFTSPASQNSAVQIGPNSFLNLTRSSTLGSLEQFGLESPGLDIYHPLQRHISHLRSSAAIGRLDSRPEGPLDSLNLETALKSIYLSSSKQESSRINFDHYSVEHSLQSAGSVPGRDNNGQHELDRRW